MFKYFIGLFLFLKRRFPGRRPDRGSRSRHSGGKRSETRPVINVPKLRVFDG